MAVAQKPFQALQEHRLGLARFRAQIELESEQPDKIVWPKNGIVQVNTLNVTASLGFERRPNESRLACSGLADQQRQRSRRKQAVLNVAQRFALGSCEEQVFGIRCELERQ